MWALYLTDSNGYKFVVHAPSSAAKRAALGESAEKLNEKIELECGLEQGELTNIFEVNEMFVCRGAGVMHPKIDT